MTQRAVFVTQAFPPVAGSHVTRALAIAEELTRHLPTTVITIEVGEDYPQRSVPVDLPDVDVVRTFPGLAHSVAHGKNAGPSRPVRRTLLQRIKAFVATVVMSLYRSLTVIDSYVDWIPHLMAAVRRKIRPDDVVVSTSMPNSVHVATLLALRGRQNQWIADFGDPWTLDRSAPTRGLRKWIEARLERAIVRRADALIFTTHSTRRDYALFYPEAADRMHVMRMAYDAGDEAITPVCLTTSTLFYGGSLPSNNRSAGELLEVARRRADWSFVFAGASVAQVQAHFDTVPDNITCIAWLDHHDFVAHLKGAGASIIFGNSNPQQIPGKVFQYSAFAPRILYVRGMDDAVDEGAALLADSVVKCENERSVIEGAIDELLSLKPALLPRDPTLEWGASVQQLARLLRTVAAGADEGPPPDPVADTPRH